MHIHNGYVKINDCSILLICPDSRRRGKWIVTNQLNLNNIDNKLMSVIKYNARKSGKLSLWINHCSSQNHTMSINRKHYLLEVPIIKEELLVIYNEENAPCNSKFRRGSKKVTNMLRRVDKPISAKLIILLYIMLLISNKL